MKTRSFLEEIITSSSEVLKDFESDMVVERRKLGNPTRTIAKTITIAQSTAGSQLFTVEPKTKKITSVKYCMYICEVEYDYILKRLTA